MCVFFVCLLFFLVKRYLKRFSVLTVLLFQREMFFLQILLFVGLAFGGVECDLCVATLDVAATLANSTSLGVIVSHFQAACAKLNHTGFYQACLKLAKDAADAVKKLPDFVSNG